MSSVVDPARQRPRIGKYVVLGRIGRGGMGMVYRGWDELLEREVAIKTLTAEGLQDEESRKRFQIEAKAVARLQHPNIVTVYELGEDRGTPFIAMELLAGSDLESLVRSGEQLLLQEKIDALVQILRALGYAHEHHIVHRDVKPSNIRLLEDGTAKMMDFGIAKLAGTDVTKSGMMVGTVHYMSPEQVRGQPLDGRSDVFSAGVILYELIAGRRPFGAGTATEVLTRIVREPAPPLPPLAEGPAVTAELIAVVDRALAKSPHDRFASAGEMADALADVATHLPQTPDAGASELLVASRRLLREGHYEESIRRLEQLTTSHPLSLEVRRTLRTARREAQKKQKDSQPPAAAEAYPELASTFQASPTYVGAPTRVLDAGGSAPTVNLHGGTVVVADTGAPTRVLHEPAAPPSSSGRGLLIGGAALLLAAAGVGVMLISSRPEPVPAPAPAPPASVATTLLPATMPGPAPAAAVRLPVASQPAGAQVALDGVAVGTTPLTLDLAPGRDHVVRVTLADHETHEVKVLADALPPKLDVALVPAGPPGLVRIASDYPVDVSWRGKTLAKGEQAPVVKVPKGRHALTVTSTRHLLRVTLNADVRAGETVALSVPPLGKLNVRAQPDNCQVFVDGTFVDYPPILDRAVAAGSHRVEFRWPDGTRRDEEVDVRPGTPTYVTGRKD